MEPRIVDRSVARTDVPSRVRALWQFGRPHTLIGTSLSITGLFVVATSVAGALPSEWVWTLGGTLVAGLCANVFIVGLNQLYDVPIDRVNKPYLPLAAGTLSRANGRRIVGASGVVALVLAVLQGPVLFVTIAVSMGIGTLYSVPPVRLKRIATWAALSIALVRGPIVNLGVYAHFSQATGMGLTVPPVIWALTFFVLGFGVAIAIAKDMPDIAGDRRHAVRTLATRLGPGRVLDLTRGVLTACYLGMVGVGVLGMPGINSELFIAAHLALLAALVLRTRAVDATDSQAIARAYRFIWRLFYLEYIVVPIAVLAA